MRNHRTDSSPWDRIGVHTNVLHASQTFNTVVGGGYRGIMLHAALGESNFLVRCTHRAELGQWVLLLFLWPYAAMRSGPTAADPRPLHLPLTLPDAPRLFRERPAVPYTVRKQLIIPDFCWKFTTCIKSWETQN